MSWSAAKGFGGDVAEMVNDSAGVVGFAGLVTDGGIATVFVVESSAESGRSFGGCVGVRLAAVGSGSVLGAAPESGGGDTVVTAFVPSQTS